MKTTPIEIVTISIAEKILRTIARREGETIKKRRSRTMIEQFGVGYSVHDPYRNFILLGAGGGLGQDGFGCSLQDLADRYKACERNTSWQNTVLASIKANRLSAD